MCGRRKQRELLQGNFSSWSKSSLRDAYIAKGELEKAKEDLAIKKPKNNRDEETKLQNYFNHY